MYDSYLVKGDLILPASCPGESLLPSLWHSFALSLSGGEREQKQKYEEMPSEGRPEFVYRDRDIGEEGEETKRRMCESERGWGGEMKESTRKSSGKPGAVSPLILSFCLPVSPGERASERVSAHACTHAQIHNQTAKIIHIHTHCHTHDTPHINILQVLNQRVCHNNSAYQQPLLWPILSFLMYPFLCESLY